MGVNKIKLKEIHGINYSTYIAIHTWLRKHYGKANKCENPECLGISTRFEYALKEGALYQRKLDNFIMLCKSCHIRRDNTRETYEKIRISSTGKRQTIERRIKQSLSKTRIKYKEIGQYDFSGKLIRTWRTQAEIFKILKVHGLSRCLNGKQPYACGFIWKYHL